MKYTKLLSDTNIELTRIKRDPYDFLQCMSHPSYFSHHILGITPYKYQHLILRKFADDYIRSNSRIMICKSRQIGISICLAILAIWYAAYNKSGAGQGTSIYKNTKVGIISKSDKQAVKLMKEIQNIIWHSKMGFSDLIKNQRGNPLSKTEIHFENGWIKAYPPTSASRGETFDLLIVDEAAFVDGDEFRDSMEPTVSAVEGKIILSSTPKGQSGFFFELFDPYDVHKEHEYQRYWFHWEMCENPIQTKMIKEKEVHARRTGDYKSFEQEYKAMFTADEEAFFEDQDVENGIDRSLSEEYEYTQTPCSIGVDYGGSKAQTAITIVTKIKNKIVLLFQFGQPNFDENLLMNPEWEHSIPNLFKRYYVQHLVVDNCPQGTRTNQQLENEGYPVLRYNFRTDAQKGERNRGYYLLRSHLKEGRIKYPDIRPLLREMKTIQEIRVTSGVFMRIKAPPTYFDDRVDSLMMACYPFLMNDGTFSSEVIDYASVREEKDKKERNLFDGRYDTEWERIKLKTDPYSFFFGKNKGGIKE